MENNQNDKFNLIQPDGSVVHLRDLQMVSLEMLKDFEAFCVEHKIHYTLCGGCCIGALRHGGFVPWDDDVDVHMLRPDYDRFYTLWNQYGNQEKYNLVKTTKDDFQDTMLTQVSLKNSTFIKMNMVHQDVDHGIKLEIIPLDGAPSNNLKRKIQMVWALVFNLFNRGFIPENRGKVVATVSKVLLKLVSSQKGRARIWLFAEKQMTQYPIETSDYVSELYVTGKYMKIRYPKEIFMGVRYAPFEDASFPIPMKAEEYLSMAFGDYMSLPDEASQVPKHDAAYINLNTSYLEYKGVYYDKK